jgi:Zn-dependent protease with chaperone function
MPKILFLIPIATGLGVAIGVQYYLANSGIPESEQTPIHFIGLGLSAFLASLVMAGIQAFYQRREKQKADKYEF